jgi:hypothetical protein
MLGRLITFAAVFGFLDWGAHLNAKAGHQPGSWNMLYALMVLIALAVAGGVRFGKRGQS